MPSPNRLKKYINGACYHIYNRGVAKQKIFLSQKDYHYFEKLVYNQRDYIKVLAYCVMPNHFHLLVRNLTARGIEKAMHSVGTSYALHYNKRNNRVGPIFQGRYKARLLESEEDIFIVMEYIHLNPEKDKARPRKKEEYPYSSAQYYLSRQGPAWFKEQLNRTTTG